MVKKQDILNVLKQVIDPELNLNVIDLGFIYDIEIKNDIVKVKMTLTNPQCPMSNFIVEEVKNAVKKLDGVKNVDVELVFDPPWTPERLSKTAKRKLGFK